VLQGASGPPKWTAFDGPKADEQSCDGVLSICGQVRPRGPRLSTGSAFVSHGPVGAGGTFWVEVARVTPSAAPTYESSWASLGGNAHLLRMLIAIIPVLVMVVGLLLWALSKNAIVSRAGEWMFVTGLLVTLFVAAKYTVRLL
jgi:hypothetical protein